eukprot:Sdes_comp20950_c0_seq20m18627
MSDSVVEKLVEMGVSRENSVKAAQESGNNMLEALKYLTCHSISPQKPLIERIDRCWERKKIPETLQYYLAKSPPLTMHESLLLVVYCLMLESGYSPVSETSPPCTVWKPTGGLYISRFTYSCADHRSGASSSSGEPPLCDFQVTLKCVALGVHLVITAGICRLDSLQKMRDESSRQPVFSIKFLVTDFVNADVPLSAEPQKLFSSLQRFSREFKDSISHKISTHIRQFCRVYDSSTLLGLFPELKIQIVSLLDVVDICHVAQTCKDLQSVAYHPSLWKLLYKSRFQTFPHDPHANWRSIFIQRFLDQQRAKRQRIHFSNPNSFDPSFMSPRIPPQIPHHHFPRTIGGDYDLFPEVGNFPGMPSQGSSGASSGWQGLSSRPTMPKNPGLPFFHP